MARVYFVRVDATVGDELFVTDGTAAGTHVVADLTSGAVGSSVANLTDVNGTIYFTANDFDGNAGYELYKSNGTAAGTVLVKDINPGDNSSVIRDLTNVNGMLFFTADDGVNGRELWLSNGTAAGTKLVKAIDPSEFSEGPRHLTNVNGTLFFVADDGNGYALWKSNGTAAGTVKVKDIDPNFPVNEISHLTNVNGTLFFQASDGTYIDDPGANHDYELWKSDGTPEGTVLVKDIAPQGVGSSMPTGLTVVNGILYFQATDGGEFSIPSGHGYELWRSDGSAGGTSLVRDIHPPFGALSEDSNPIALTNVNGTLFFIADDGVNGPELWKSDGTAAGTVLVKNIFPGAEYFDSGIALNSLTNVNGTLFFMADDGTHGYELWKSDGTAAGTVMVKDVRPGADSFGSENSAVFLAVGKTLYFAANDGTDPIVQLWKSDGTAAGTVKVSGRFDGLDIGNLLLIGPTDGDDFVSGGPGADTMAAGLGNDTYVVNHAGDVVKENANQGKDTVQVTLASYTLGANVENLTFTTAIAHAGNGNTLANTITGAGRNDVLTGLAGSDALNGGAGNDTLNGGTGADTASGGVGNDIYAIDQRGDKVVEAAGGGTDNVRTAVSYTLAADTEIETLQTTDASATTAISLTGNAFKQVLIGNAGNNLLNGGGGADLMSGGAGNDIYVVDNTADRIVDAAGNGNDTLRTSASYKLAANAEVETLQTSGAPVAALINLTGNAIDQTIIGHNGANVLNGGGGADTMTGLAGNDTYIVDNAGDKVVEAAIGGTDAVRTGVSYTLAAGAGVETLQTLGATTTAAIDLTGSDLVNALIGNAGSNVLNGKGRSDTLTGGAGTDFFRFDSALNASNNVDAITDFSVANDTIQLDDGIFTALGAPGPLDAAAFNTGTTATDADDRIVYNAATGALTYDADGNGVGSAAIRFATLPTNLAITNLDFEIV